MKLMWTDIKKEFNEKGYFKGYECSQNMNIEYKREEDWLLANNNYIYLIVPGSESI